MRWCKTRFAASPICIWGRYNAKEWKNRGKVHYFLWAPHKMQCVYYRIEQLAEKEVWANYTRTRVGAHSNRNVVFLLSQVSHNRWKMENNREKMQEKLVEIRWNMRKNRREKTCFTLFSHGFREENVKTHQKQQIKLYDIGFYKLSCDTCDSKNTKTPVLRVYTRARQRGRL